jgi:hypothetical protein
LQRTSLIDELDLVVVERPISVLADEGGTGAEPELVKCSRSVSVSISVSLSITFPDPISVSATVSYSYSCSF